MSARHPVIAITGSSGAGTTTVRSTFQQIFRREGVTAAIVEGDAFHRFDRFEMRERIAAAHAEGRGLSHFGPDGNLFEELEALFRTYGESGSGMVRKYLHDDNEAAPYGLRPGSMTPWEPIAPGSDLLFYEGLHGGVASGDVDVAQHTDMLVGVVPIINLEWIQKLHRDKSARGHSHEAIVDTILRRMPDYVNYIVPQFSRTDVNFQRVPVVDTSNPFISRTIPTAGESLVVIRFRDPAGIDFPYLIAMLHDSFMSRRNTIVCPGDKMDLAMQLIFTPMVARLVERTRGAARPTRPLHPERERELQPAD